MDFQVKRESNRVVLQLFGISPSSKKPSLPAQVGDASLSPPGSRYLLNSVTITLLHWLSANTSPFCLSCQLPLDGPLSCSLYIPIQ